MPITKTPERFVFRESRLTQLTKAIGENEGERREQFINELFNLLHNREMALPALDRPEVLRIKNSDGWMAIDEIASYATTDVAVALLDRAKQDHAFRKLVSESHPLDGGVEVEAFTLAIVNLKTAKVDHRPYLELAREIGATI